MWLVMLCGLLFCTLSACGVKVWRRGKTSAHKIKGCKRHLPPLTAHGRFKRTARKKAYRSVIQRAKARRCKAIYVTDENYNGERLAYTVSARLCGCKYRN